MAHPIARSAVMASVVSRAFRWPRTTDGDSLRAASTSARFVIDLEPGSRSRARTGSCAGGVFQRPESIALRLSPRQHRLAPGGGPAVVHPTESEKGAPSGSGKAGDGGAAGRPERGALAVK